MRRAPGPSPVPMSSVFSLEVTPNIPARLARLEDLAGNLWYGWDATTRSLFSRLHPALWDAVGHSPKAMLKRIDEQRLAAAATDPVFLNTFNRVLSAFDTYLHEPIPGHGLALSDAGGLVAYFCAEFGFHESLPIYSGGLGILAGDHCKAASDMQLPFVAVGLLYRQGYFTQTIDGDGNQHSAYFDSAFEDMPIHPVTTAGGNELFIELALGERSVWVKVWRAHIGHVHLYLLDTDVDANSERDRAIAHRLYGGDRTTRLEQELVLGLGGVRALAALGIKPTVWHLNEGHPAFLILERIRDAMRNGVDFDAALEAVAANTVFTTHTPVPAGHDHFAQATVAAQLEPYCRECGVPVEKVLALGHVPGGNGEFNMTALAIRGSRHHNGVSRIHGGVSATMLRDLWPQLSPAENPIGYITNGVHIPTFLAPEWADVFDRFLGMGWLNRLDEAQTREQIYNIPDHVFWSVRQHLKAQLLMLVRQRIRRQLQRNHESESRIDRMLRYIDPANPNVLTVGFGRRFATYKRAALLFNDLDRLRELMATAGRPVVFIFAGKAHPADEPGQDMIRAVTRVSRLPEFEGRVLMVEGYDMRFARRLVSGVDVWLNNPVYPLEASGTSGMKAGMNGVINLSVLDGWWDEGYDGQNGWALKPASAALDAQRRDREEALALYLTLQDQVLPLYYERSMQSTPADWIRVAKRSMASLLPRFNAARMVNEYTQYFYVPAARQGRVYAEHASAAAAVVAAWKARVREAWPGVTLRRLDQAARRIRFGERIVVEVAVRLNGLLPDDVAVELVLTRGLLEAGEPERRYEFVPQATAEAGTSGATGSEQPFVLELQPELCGRLDYRIRMVPRHPLLTHPFELGLMLWI